MNLHSKLAHRFHFKSSYTTKTNHFSKFISSIFSYDDLLTDIFLTPRIPTTSNTGNTIPARIPSFRFSDSILETAPTSVGPPEHPRSPASASNANNAVPPFLIEADAILNVPGHMIPTDNPQIPQPIKEKIGDGDKEIIR